MPDKSVKDECADILGKPPTEEEKIAAAPRTKVPPHISINAVGDVYDAGTATWDYGYQSVFRLSAHHAAINIFSAGNKLIIPGEEGKSIRIVSIFLVVGDLISPDTTAVISLFDGAAAITGPMNFAGDGQPRGIVIPFPYSPLGLAIGNEFSITVSTLIQVSGSVCYFYQ